MTSPPQWLKRMRLIQPQRPGQLGRPQMPGQASAVPPPNTHPVSTGKQKCVLFPLQVSLPAVHGLGLKGLNGKVIGIPGKREVGVGTGRLTVCILVPFVLAEVPLPVCHCGSESRHGDSLPASCHPPSAHLLPRPQGSMFSTCGSCVTLGKWLNLSGRLFPHL